MIFVAAAVVVLVAAVLSANFYTDLLWFQEVELTSVLFRSLYTQLGVGLAVGVLVAAFLYLNLWIASRSLSAYGGPRDPVDQYRDMMAPYLRWIRLGLAILIGFGAGAVASSQWQIYLLWANGGDFGITDPQFGRDVGFYVFDLPFYEAVVSQIWSALFTALLFSAGAHFFYGAIRPQRGLQGIASRALAHLSVLLGLLALTKAVQYWLGTYGLNFSPRGVVTGASYTDVNAQLPALRLLAIISIISALLFLVNIGVRRFSLPLAAVGIWILTAFLAGAVWPTVVQRFSVEPQEPQREEQYIKRNLEATNRAFGLSESSTQSFPARNQLSVEAVEANQSLLQNVRLWDPELLKEAYAQLQAIRTYYDFEDVDVDRYVIDGETRQVLLSARELTTEQLPEESRNWANIHLQYTHGYGLVASLANSRTTAGQPAFLVKDVPGTPVAGADILDPEQPRIYYGETFEDDDYAIVNSQQQELDYEDEDGVVRSNYEGEGGIPISSFFRKLAFAVRESDPNFILSGLLDDDSRTMIYRDVRERVRRAAPFLDLDQDPYPAVVDDHIVWILDGYTSTRWYPYSQRFDAGAELNTQGSGVLDGEINYVRNSVKITVDAYDGTMEFYVIDDTDPLIQAWRSAFPDLFTDEEPSESLAAHFRYPEDLFRLQTEVYRTYHIEDAFDFYSKQDAWDIPATATLQGSQIAEGGLIEPVYLLLRLPGETEEEFVLTRPYTPRGKRNMIALMAARSDPANFGEIVLLEFPRSISIPGPIQVDNLINQEPEIARELSLLRQEGSNVEFGPLVVLPIEDSLLYVQSLFVRAESGGIPEIKRIFMVLGEDVVMEDTFEQALAEILNVDAVAPPSEPTDPEEPTEPEEPEEPQETGEAAELLQRAAALYERAQQALADGDFETYGRLIERLGDLLQQAEEAG